MVGLGKERKITMYHYIEDKQFLKRAQSSCSKDMQTLEQILREEYDINSQFFLVGSGARNMITQNENGSVDFDYNLNILSCPDWYDEKYIKESVRKVFNKVMRMQGLADVEDSTSSLTTKLMSFNNGPDIEFRIDVCIVTKNNNGIWERLIHNKTGFSSYDSYTWNTAQNSKHYQEKAKQIKSVPGWWTDVLRPKYLERKNRYLRHQDRNHPSFICYIEVVNDVYNEMKQKRIL